MYMLPYIHVHVQGRQKQGGWGGPSRPTFHGKICRCGHESVHSELHAVNINRVLPLGSWIV